MTRTIRKTFDFMLVAAIAAAVAYGAAAALGFAPAEAQDVATTFTGFNTGTAGWQ